MATMKRDPEKRQDKGSAKSSVNEAPQMGQSRAARSLPPDSEMSVSQDVTQATKDEVARLAYSYWQERLSSDIDGSAEEDWYRAEKDLAG